MQILFFPSYRKKAPQVDTLIVYLEGVTPTEC